ncbi:hypothetical protein Tco_1129886, partial [Tanacetum coccineum]
MVESPFNKFKEEKIRVKQRNYYYFKGKCAAGPSRVVKCYNCQGEGHMTDDLDAYDSDCDDLSSAKAVLMENLSSCDPEVLSKVPYFDSYLNYMINYDVQEMQYSEQTHVDDFEDNEIHS